MKRPYLLAAALVFGLAHTGRAAVLFNNLGATTCCEGPIVSGFPFADSFSTGASAFDFTSLTVSLLADQGIPPSGLTITALLLADSSKSPGPVLETIGTLAESALPAKEHVQVTFNTSFDLAAATRYWIELTSNDTSLGFVEWDSSADLSGTTGTSGEFWFATSTNSVFPDGTNGGPLQMEVFNTIPEPSPLVMLAAGLAGLGILRRRKRS